MPDAVTHPTPRELSAFGLGKLPDAAAAAVARHLEGCEACRQAVAALPPDSFIGKVRAARPGAPAAHLPDVPPELASHPKFTILRELGRGGMGIVYQARQTVMNRQVVIKVINKALLDQPGALERFRREVQTAASLSHPNIVTAYDAEQAGDLHMLVMEFVPGRSLAEVLEKEGPLPVAEACDVARQAALGLQHAHERGMVHRDVKPHNLIRTPKGQVKILDFGLAKVASERSAGKGLTESGAYMGTPEYSAPEQAQDARTADIRADLYSLGCTLYCLLAGRPPFQEDTPVKTILAHQDREPMPLPRLRPEVPAGLWAVVARLLAKDPRRRYQTPAEVAQVLAAFGKVGPKAPPFASAPGSSGRPAAGGATAGPTETRQMPPVRRAPEPPRPAPTAAPMRPTPPVRHPPAPPPPAPPSAEPPRPRPETSRTEAVPDEAEWVPAVSAEPAPGGSRGRQGMLAAAIVLGVLVVGGIVVALLIPRTGTLLVEGMPSGTTLQLNNQQWTWRDDGTVRIPGLAPGLYQVTITGEEFEPLHRTAKIVAGKETPCLILGQMKRKTGTLLVTDMPEGTQLEWGNEQRPRGDDGTVRIEGLPLGRLRLKVTGEEYEDAPFERDIHLGLLKYQVPAMRKKTGTLLVTNLPPGTRVEWSGGQRPRGNDGTVRIEGLPLGRLRLKVTGEGYEDAPFERDIHLGSQEYQVPPMRKKKEEEEKPPPEKRKGILVLEGLPANARVLLKGKEAALVPGPDGTQSTPLDEGSYKLEVTAEGFLPYTADVSIKAGEETRHKVMTKSDPIRVQLDKAEASYQADKRKLDKQLLESLDKEEKAARKAGNTERVDQIKQERAAFEKDGTLPTGVVSKAASDYQQKLRTAYAARLGAYKAAAREYTKANLDDKADEMLNERKRLEANAPPAVAGNKGTTPGPKR